MSMKSKHKVSTSTVQSGGVDEEKQEVRRSRGFPSTCSELQKDACPLSAAAMR